MAQPSAPALPPAAKVTVDFDRDILPLLDRSCLRCHGGEKPKSHFHLDQRELALKGGRNNTNDIVPGNSARSQLIRYVAQLEPDMEMPPPGKGDPLTPQQVGLLRAWIDQGASWGMSAQFPITTASMTPLVRWISVDGDRKKFRELENLTEGFGGGVDYFTMEEQDAPDQKLTVEAHARLPEQDFQLKITQTKTDVGFVRGGFEQWRHYYDDTGGFYPLFTPSSFDLGRDLELDIGRVWVELGLTVPDRPQITLGYEYQYKQGTKSMLEWGTVFQGANAKNIYPAAKDIDENVQIVKLDFLHEWAGWRIQDNARVEIYNNQTVDQQVNAFTTGPAPDSTTRTRQDFSHVQGMNTFHLEKQITSWWLCSGGYYYSRLEGDSSLSQTTVDALNAPTFGNFWSDQVTLRRESQIFSVASQFLPFDGLSLSIASQNEFSHQEGFGDVNLDSGIPTVPGLFFPLPGRVQSDFDQTRTMQNATLRYTKIPFTVLFADGRFTQDSIGEFDQEATTGGASLYDYTLKTDYANYLEDFRVGFDTSPWRWVALNAHYRYRDSNSDYDPTIDTTPGYPGFISHRDMHTDEVETKLTIHPATWLKNSFTYQRTSSDYRTTTDALAPVTPGGQLLSGNYDAHVYGFNATLIPSQRLYLSGTFTYSDSRMTTWAQDNVSSVVPYRGGIYSVITSATYALDNRTDLKAAYTFSRAGYGQHNTDGQPLGLDYAQHGLTVGIARRLNSRLATSLRYSFYRYEEPGTGGVNSFNAQGIFATVTMKWL
jgi:hypothetical protein